MRIENIGSKIQNSWLTAFQQTKVELINTFRWFFLISEDRRPVNDDDTKNLHAVIANLISLTLWNRQ